MTNLTTYLENQVQTWWANGTSFDSPPTDIYIGLHTGDPGNDASANEVSAIDYDRLQTSYSDWSVSGSEPTVVTNDNDLSFPQAQNNWGDVSHVSLWDSQSGGNSLWQGAADSTQTVNDGQQYVIPSGNFTADLL